MWSQPENWCRIGQFPPTVALNKRGDSKFSPFISSMHLLNITKLFPIIPALYLPSQNQNNLNMTSDKEFATSTNGFEEGRGFASTTLLVPSLISSWRFLFDIILILLLAVSALVANFGLLYLTRLTKPALQGKNSSFSMSGPVSQYYWSGRMSTTSAQLRERVKLRRIFSCLPSSSRKPTVIFDVSMEESVPSVLPIRKCASSVSITRVSAAGGAPISSINPLTPRSRRHQRYVNGIFGLSISNITVSFSLLLWCVCSVVDRLTLVPWIAVLSVANSAIADIAQSLEISAVLWIALERALGIRWPRERRSSSCTPDQLQNPNWTTKFRVWLFGPCCVAQPSRQWDNTKRGTGDKNAGCFPTHSNSVFQFNSGNLWTLNFWKTMKSSIRIILSLFPFALFVVASVPSLISFVHQIQMINSRSQIEPIYFFSPDTLITQPGLLRLNNSANRTLGKAKLMTVIYYTNTIVSALVIGQFLAPLAILITTNLLIYKKVASRDKRFFSRQSSNTSKSSFVSGNSVTVTGVPSYRKGLFGNATNGTIPLLRVLESSNQDLRQEETTNIQEDSTLTEAEQDKNTQNLLFVPTHSPRDIISCSTTACSTSSFRTQRRRSTSALCGGTECELSNSQTELKCTSNRKMSFGTPQIRRKSSNDVFASLFHSRGTDVIGRPGEEPLLLQMLRRQHRRTLRILIILLLSFVVCRAPRAIVLLIGWLQSPSLCSDLLLAFTWLWYTTLWSQTSAVLDTIVYGFWGNRNCRIHLSRWCSNHSFRLLCPR